MSGMRIAIDRCWAEELLDRCVGLLQAAARRGSLAKLMLRFSELITVMRVGVIFAFVASLLLAGLNSAMAEPHTSSYHGQRQSAFMRSFGTAQPPYGFVRFCDSHPQHCRSNWQGADRFEATPARLSQLDEINRLVNASVEPITDYEAYGVEEFWTLPTSVGDCEDYALLKRERLIELGWPESALLLTVVRDEQGDGHAVLTARTVHGDFVLDNKIDEVKIWNATSYQFVMRQSFVNPRAWVSLEESVLNRPVTMAGSAARR